MKLMVDHLIGELRKRLHNIADPRNGSNLTVFLANFTFVTWFD